MRGKTNIPPRKQPVINGETHNFVVATGNTITKGDFVSYVLNSQYSQFDARTMTLVYKYEYDTINHKFVLAFDVTNASPIVMLVQITQGSLVVLDSVTVAVTNKFVGAFCDGTYVYTCDSPTAYSSTTAQIVVNKYQVVNDELSLVQTYTQGKAVVSSRHYPMGFAVVGDTLYYFTTLLYSSSTYRLYAYYTTLGVDFSSTDEIILSQAVGSSSETMNMYLFGNYIVCVCGVTISSSSNRVEIYIIDTTANTFTKYSESTFGSEQLINSDVFDSKLCLVTNTKIRFLEYTGSGVFVSLYNETQSSNASKAIIGRISQTDYVVFSVGVKTTLYSLGAEITKKENTLNSVITPYGLMHYILSDFVTYIVLECTTSNGVVKYFGGIDEQQGFVLGEPTNYVQEYNGGYTVGFAKTSGTGGDTIQVYTPLSS